MTMPGDAVIIEVGLNEGAARAVNPHVPVTPAECAADALRCRDAGASTIHWHARDPSTGEQQLGDADLYAEALGVMRSAGLVGYPSYPVDAGLPVERRLDHVWDLQARGELEIAPIDLGSVSTIPWSRGRKDFADLDGLRARPGVVDNPLTFVLDAVERAEALRMPMTFGAFDVGCSRIVRMLVESGWLTGPVLHKVFLSEGWAVGPLPSVAALELHVAQLPEGLDGEWMVVPYSSSDPAVIEQLCRAALERGGHVRVGIGDSAAANPAATNAELVEQVAVWAGDAGRPVATTADVRERLGLAVG